MKEIYDRLANIFKPVLNIQYGDKILHAMIFGSIGFFVLLLPEPTILYALALTMTTGLLWEISATLSNISKIDLLDLVADLVGGLITSGVLFYFGIPLLPLGF